MPKPRPWHRAKPCHNCPFTRGPEAVRLTRGRIREVTDVMLSTDGGTFPCHKTVRHLDSDDGHEDQADLSKSLHCAGALIFAEKHGNATQMMRIAERTGGYDAAKLMADKPSADKVFDSLGEMLATALR